MLSCSVQAFTLFSLYDRACSLHDYELELYIYGSWHRVDVGCMANVSEDSYCLHLQ